jgi:autotransporter-associated beta strand protein
LAPLVALLVGPAAADAQTFSWTQPPTGTSANWTTGPWSPGPPTSSTTTILEFNTYAGSGAFTFTNNVGPFTVNGINLNANAIPNILTLDTTNTIRFDGTDPFLANHGPGNVVISGSGGVNLANGLAVGGAGNGTVVVETSVIGSGGITVNQTGLGIFDLRGTNTFTGGVTVTGGVLSLGSAAALGNASNTLTINGGALRFTTGAAIANSILANADLVTVGGIANTPILSGVISGSGGVRLQSYDNGAGLILQNANTYTGATTLQSYIPNSVRPGPSLTLGGPNGSISSLQTVTVGKNATLNIGATGSANADRIPDTAPVVVNGGTINYVPVTAGTTEVLGTLTVNGSLRLGTTASGVSTLQFGTLTRNDGGVLWLTNNNFGPTATRVFFTGATQANMTVAAGSGTGTELGVVPFAVGGSATNPRSFVTYDATNGLQVVPFNDAAFVRQVNGAAAFTADIGAGALTNRNVHLNGAGTYNLAGTTQTVNAVTTTGTTVTITNGTLRVHSGAVVNFNNVIWGNGATLDFQTRTGYLHSSAATVFTGTSQITGSGGLVVAGMGITLNNFTTFENTAGNPFTGGLTITGNVNVGFNQDNQLGAAGGTVTFSGGMLAYNAAGDLTIGRNIRLGEGNGGFSFNVIASGSAAPTATAGTTLTLSGVITGPGAFIKEGVGTVNLSGSNSYSGGTVVAGGTLQFTTDGNLGQAGARIVMHGGILQPLAAGTFARPVEMYSFGTILTNANVTLSSPLSRVSQLYLPGPESPDLFKAGTGALTLTAASPNLSGNVGVTAGTLALAGASGSAPQVSHFRVSAGATLTLDNTAGYNGNRIGDFSLAELNGGALNYVAGPAATGDPAERFGLLSATASGSRVNIDGTAATSPTVLRFARLSIAPNANVLFSGTNLGATTGNFTRVLFDTAPATTVVGTIPFASYSGTSNGAAESPAAYDSTRGVFQFVSPAVNGTVINNFAPENVPVSATFTTTGNAVAKTGATVYTLTLDGGSTLTLDGGNAASATNANAPDGTLHIASGLLTTQNGAKSVVVGTAPGPTIAFGIAQANITTTSDLTIASGVSLTGSGGFVKSGPGTLTMSGAYNVTGGPLAVNAGTFAFGPSGTIAAGTALTVASGATFNGGGISAAYGTATIDGTLNQNGGTASYAGLVVNGAFNLGTGGAASTAALSGPGTIDLGTGTLTLTGLITFNGTVTGSGSLAHAPPGPIQPLTLGGNNTFTGGVTGNEHARLIITHPSAFGTGTVDVSAQTATSSFSNPTLGFNFGTGVSSVVANNIVLSRRNATGNVAINIFVIARTSFGQTITLAGVISSGTASGTTVNRIVFDESGTTNSNTFVLTNSANSFVANVQVDRGTLAITSDGALGAGTNQLFLNTNNVPLNGNGTLRLDADGITINRQVNVTANAASVNTREFTGAISGVLAGSSTFAKLGTGTLILSNTANTHTGVVNVNNGTLLVNGNLAGISAGVNLNANPFGTIGGTGTIGAAGTPRTVNVNTAGRLYGGNPAAAVGTDPGTLTITGNITVNSGGNLAVRLTGGNPGAANSGTSSGGSAGDPAHNGYLIQTGTFTFTLISSAIVLIDGTGVPFTLGSPYSYAVVQTAGATGLNFTTLSQFQTIGFAGSNFSLTESGGVVYLNFTPVPEPATALALAAGVLGLAGLARRFARRPFRRIS